MTADSSSSLAINVLMGCALSLMIIFNGSIIVNAQQYDFTNERYNTGEV